jgi:hypothetical protein
VPVKSSSALAGATDIRPSAATDALNLTNLRTPSAVTPVGTARMVSLLRLELPLTGRCKKKRAVTPPMVDMIASIHGDVIRTLGPV